jgi:predicted RND superfamily exporter protein
VGETGWPILFTAVTTIGGLISFLFAGIGALHWVGITSSLAVFAVYFYVILLVPILYSIGKDRQGGVPAAAENGTAVERKFYRFEEEGEALIEKHRPAIIIAVVVIIAFIPDLFGMAMNMDYFFLNNRKKDPLHRPVR